MEPWIVHSIWIAGPILISPLVIIALGPLFAIFLREGVELFTENEITPPQARQLARPFALRNVLILSLAGSGIVACQRFDAPAYVCPIVAALALLAAFWITTVCVQYWMRVERKPALLVGLVTFSGGNLPIMIAVPTAVGFI